MDNTIAYAGNIGAFAQLAKESIFKGFPEYSCKNFSEVFDAIVCSKASFAVVPIENNTGGPVWDTYQLLYNSLVIEVVGEYFSPIYHNFIGFQGTSADDVELVLSHPQALAQCARKIRETFPQARIQPFSTTSAAVEYVKAQGDKSMVAIGSKEAARYSNLSLLSEGVQDNFENTTRFLILKNKNISTDMPLIQNNVLDKRMISLKFSVSDNTGSLAKALDVFSANEINFLNLRNFLVGSSFKPLNFYVEIESLLNKKVQEKAFDELSKIVKDFSVLGEYYQHLFRK